MSYVIAGVFFILSLGGLSHQETARRGNLFGIAGMLIALTMTLTALAVIRWEYLLPVMLVGAAIGAFVAGRVEMVQMPQLVALLHSFVGVAAVLVGYANYLDPTIQYTGVERNIHSTEIYLGVFIGAITFTGSIVAFGKLQGVFFKQTADVAGATPNQSRHRYRFGYLGLLVFGCRFRYRMDQLVDNDRAGSVVGCFFDCRNRWCGYAYRRLDVE